MDCIGLQERYSDHSCCYLLCLETGRDRVSGNLEGWNEVGYGPLFKFLASGLSHNYTGSGGEEKLRSLLQSKVSVACDWKLDRKDSGSWDPQPTFYPSLSPLSLGMLQDKAAASWVLRLVQVRVRVILFPAGKATLFPFWCGRRHQYVLAGTIQILLKL